MIIKKDKSQFENFLYDAANVHGTCEKVYFPETEDEIIEVVNYANKNNLHLTVAGNGTGLTGARVPENGIVLSTEKLNKILELNEKEKYVIVQPGVILKDLDNYVESKKLFYPPDPTERNGFVGANVATNASGAKTFKYGPTRDYVLALKIILSCGDILYLKRGDVFANGYSLSLHTESGERINLDIPPYSMPKTKHAAGYFCKENMDAIDLFIGSEGTLGIISEVKLKLIEYPKDVLSSVIFFDKEKDALNFISEAKDLSFKNRKNNEVKNINARGLEFFDYYALQFLKDDYPQIPNSAEAAVWFEQDYKEISGDDILNLWIELIEKYNGNEKTAWFALNRTEREKFKDFRHTIAWKVTEYLAKNEVKKVGTDTAVPDNVFKEFYFYGKKCVEEKGLNYVIYGHFGNSHMHLNMLPKDEKEYEIAKNIYFELCRKAVELEGTISAEHGIGKLKREYLKMMYGEENIKAMAKLKLQLDPNKILGIGNIFDPKYLESF